MIGAKFGFFGAWCDKCGRRCGKGIYPNKCNCDQQDIDIVIRMPPKHQYKIELDVTSIKKAKPKVFLGDWGR